MRFQRDRHSIEAGEEKGRDYPDWYLERPDVDPEDIFYLSAFWELDTTRAIGFGGVGKIPWDKMVQYGEFHGLDEDLLPGFVQIIREMDAGYLAWVAAEMKEKGKQDA